MSDKKEFRGLFVMVNITVDGGETVSYPYEITLINNEQMFKAAVAMKAFTGTYPGEMQIAVAMGKPGNCEAVPEEHLTGDNLEQIIENLLDVYDIEDENVYIVDLMKTYRDISPLTPMEMHSRELQSMMLLQDLSYESGEMDPLGVGYGEDGSFHLDNDEGGYAFDERAFWEDVERRGE